MKSFEIKSLISKGETETFEFKEHFSDDTVETLVAFSNTRGGKIIVGVTDDGKIIGDSYAKESLQVFINEIKQKTDGKIIPNAEFINYEGKILLIFSISEYPSKPISFKGKYYKRVRGANHLMTTDEVVNEYLRARNKSWDMFMAEEVSLVDLDFSKITKIIQLINKRRDAVIDEDPLSFLKKYDLIQGDRITNAAHLLFSKKPLYFTDIQIGLFETETVIKKSITIRNDLISEVDGVMDFIMGYITKEYIITGKPQREEKWQYPLSAIREFVVNAIVHRDYQNGTHSQFKVFSKKLELWNIGTLPLGLSISDLYSGEESSRPRNLKLAEIFKEVGVIERYGSGVKRAVSEIVNFGLPKPEITERASGLNVKIFGSNDPVNEPVNDPVNEPVNKFVSRKEKILNLIIKNKKIDRISLAKFLNVDLSTVKRDLLSLKREGVIKRIGSDKTGFWEIIKT